MKLRLAALAALALLCTVSLLLAAAPAPAGRVSAAAASFNSAFRAPWSVTTVDSTGDVGRFASLALNPSTGAPNIVYIKATNQRIEDAHYTPGAGNCVPNADWTCNDRLFINQGSFLSLAFGPLGSCAYVYQTTDMTSNFFNNEFDCFGGSGSASGSLLNKVQTGATGLYNSLKFDGFGTPHLAFQTVSATGYLQYAAPVNNSSNCDFWRCDVIDSGPAVGAGASIGLNFAGAPRIAYRGGGGHLKYAHYISPTAGNCGPANTWQCDLIDAGAVVSQSIALNEPTCFLCGAGAATRIAYVDTNTGNLKYAVFKGSGGNCGPAGSWQCDVIDSVGSQPAPGVSLDVSSDTPFIAYYDTNDYPQSPHGVLKIARPVTALGALSGNCGPNNVFDTWQCDVLDDGGFFGNNVGQFPSLAINTAGLATIAYYDASDGKLKVAYQRLQTFLPLTRR